MSRLKQHFQDIKPINNKMTATEKEWYRDFVLGFYGRQKPRLRKLCKTDEQYQHELVDLRYAAHENQRNTIGGTQRSYTSEDWVTEDSIAVSFEDALIDAIDAGIRVDSVIGFEK